MPERSGAAGRAAESPLIEAGAEDAGAIARLHIESWRATYANELSPAFLAGRDPEAHAQSWRREMDSGVLLLLARHEDGITGFVACGPARGDAAGPREWEIYNLHVAPQRKGQGLGSRLFDEAARRGAGQGARDLILWVVETNRPARSFYERKGMRCDGGRQEHSVGPAESLIQVRYRMSLSDRGRP
jgi:ribosomal protein S18 acetylase RimI-like enzyme